MHPCHRLRWHSAALTNPRTEKKLTSNVLFHASISRSSNRATASRTPWLSTSESRRPHFSMASSTAFLPMVKSLRSPQTTCTCVGYWDFRVSRGSRLRATTTRLWNWGARRRYCATVRPMPILGSRQIRHSSSSIYRHYRTSRSTSDNYYFGRHLWI